MDLGALGAGAGSLLGVELSVLLWWDAGPGAFGLWVSWGSLTDTGQASRDGVVLDSSSLRELFKMYLHFILNKQSIAWAWLSFLFPEKKIGTFPPANIFIV